ncbi:hypothetical protein CAMRE0001_1707 [Campylobacter rectus RM3267]|uniref:Uncharacterized protein n=1 Tax=Campylobacter rectus RM3267 TaxID=553218 RepID=B9CZB9_CAMRE|nr:hypothetical protein CAMRE0001_1707 [Campylobacter rectus RM3267]
MTIFQDFCGDILRNAFVCFALKVKPKAATSEPKYTSFRDEFDTPVHPDCNYSFVLAITISRYFKDWAYVFRR